MQPLGQSKPKQFRLSCDKCLEAKVKCGKERPLCSRCINLGHTCVYSPSRRTGKPKGCGKNSIASDKSSSSNVLSQTNSPIIAPSRGLSGDDSLWPLNISYSSSNHLSAFGDSIVSSESSTANSSPPNFAANPFGHDGGLGLDDPMGDPFMNFLNSEFKDSTDYMTAHQRAYSLGDLSSCTTDAEVQYPESICDTSGFDLSNFGKEHVVPACGCLSTLQETPNVLSASLLPFDQLIAVNRSVVASVTSYMSCSCLPDISAVMLLSLIVTRLVEWYKKTLNGEHPGFNNVGVTMGTLKIDTEDEYRIKMMLVRSELLKIKSLINRLPTRFENYLQGSERRMYRASVEFLEGHLDNFIQEGPIALG